MKATSIRSRSATAACAAALAACGGGAVALLAYVAPIGGSWRLDGNADVRLNPDGDTTVLLFDPVFSAPATLLLAPPNKLGSCSDGAVTWSLDHRDSSLLQGGVACAHGVFQDDGTIDFGGGAILRNTLNFQPQLDPGVWVDAADPAHRIKFNTQLDPFAGCEFKGATQTGTLGAISITSSDPASGAPATIVFTIARAALPPEQFSNGVFRGVSTMRLDSSNGGSLTLERRRDDTTACP